MQIWTLLTSWATVAVVVPIAIGIGLGVINMSPPVYTVAQFCFTFAGLALMLRFGWWLAFEQVTTGFQSIFFSFVVFGIIGALWLASMCWTTNRQLLEPRGWLYPANDPLPADVNRRQIPPDLFLVFLGNVVSGNSSFPYTVLQVKDRKIIVLERAEDGAIGISMDVYSMDGKIIARIEKGRFIVNKNNILDMERRDQSSLRIIDEEGNKVLGIRYFNPRAIWIDAILYCPGLRNPVILKGSDLRVSNIAIDGKIAVYIGPKLR